MAVLYITEYADVMKGTDLPVEPASVEQTVAIGGASVASSAFNNTTRAVRLETDAICSVRFGTAPTALATSRRMQAGDHEVFAVFPGQSMKVAVISNT